MGGQHGDQWACRLYHTHSDESFSPPVVVHQGCGDIYQVGRTFRDALEELGYKAIWSQNNHNHDARLTCAHVAPPWN